MNSLNKAQIIGNLTRDPELRQTKNNQSVCTVGVATNRSWTDSNGERHEEAEFHSVVCWGRLAEIVAEFLKKGSKVFFEGRLRTRNWEDEGGHKHYRTEIIAEDMIILGGKAAGNGNGDDNNKNYDNAPDPSSGNEDFEDLPF